MTSTSDLPAAERGETEPGSDIPPDHPGMAPGSVADAGTWTGGLRRWWIR